MPRLPLARSHRPQRFAEVLGQQVPVRALGSAAAHGNIASAYIFSGTRGIGKTTIARIFAKTLNCSARVDDDCCDQCTTCREIAEGRALDVLELDAATHTGIDDIRELREAAQYPPSRDRYRVFILDEAHQLSTSAWNGLLKILEEPPPWCVFLFCTTEPHKIPQTIESRALHFSFKSPTPAQIASHLGKVAQDEGIEIDEGALELLVQAADGSVRDGLSALDQVRALASGAISRDAVRSALGLVPGEAVTGFVAALGAGDAAAALAVVAELDAEGQDLRAFTADALERVRQLALVQVAGPRVVAGGDALAEAASAFGIEQLVWLGRVLDETETRLRQGGAQRALLDLATVRMTRMAGLASLSELVDRLGSGSPAPGGVGGGGTRGLGREAPPPRPAAPPPRPAPGPARRAEPSTAAPAAPPRAGTGELLTRLVDAVQETRPALAEFLRAVTRAELVPGGPLRLTLPPGKPVIESQLSREANQEAVLAALTDLTGATATGIELASNGTAAAPRVDPREGRREALERARKDPVVRALFDHFGAVVLEGQLLAGDAPAPAPPVDVPQDFNP